MSKTESEFIDNHVTNLQFEKLPKELLVQIAYLYTRFMRAIDGFWYLSVMEQAGNDKAKICDIQVWQKMIGYEVKHIKRQFGITGNDLTAMFKAFQIEPIFQGTTYRVDFFKNHEAVMTVTECPILNALEKEGDEREAWICDEFELMFLQCFASEFNTNIKIESLISHPRQQGENLYCRWRFTQEYLLGIGGMQLLDEIGVKAKAVQV